MRAGLLFPIAGILLVACASAYAPKGITPAQKFALKVIDGCNAHSSIAVTAATARQQGIVADPTWARVKPLSLRASALCSDQSKITSELLLNEVLYATTVLTLAKEGKDIAE